MRYVFAPRMHDMAERTTIGPPGTFPGGRVVRRQDIGEVTRFDLPARGRRLLGGYWTTCYRLGDVMVDAGPVHRGKALVAALGPGPIRQVLLTHSHEDHIGGVGALRRAFPEAGIGAHRETLRVLRDPKREQPEQIYRRLVWGWPDAVSGGTALADGDVVTAGPFRFRVVHTPGHSPDHLCFLEEDRGYLFTGDLYVGGRDIGIRSDADIWALIASLERIAALRPKVMLPGAARIPGDPVEALNRKIDYYRQLGERVLQFHARGWPEDRIARSLLGRWHRIELLTQGHFTRLALVRSFLRGSPSHGGTPGVVSLSPDGDSGGSSSTGA